MVEPVKLLVAELMILQSNSSLPVTFCYESVVFSHLRAHSVMSGHHVEMYTVITEQCTGEKKEKSSKGKIINIRPKKSGGATFHFHKTVSFFSTCYTRDFSSGVLYVSMIGISQLSGIHLSCFA